MGESCPEGNLSSRASQPLKSSRGHIFCFSFFLRFALLSERGLPHKLTSQEPQPGRNEPIVRIAVQAEKF